MKSVSPEGLEYLKSCYAEPHRFYHTWAHVEALQKFFASHPFAPILNTAAMFHDAVYEILRHDNEEQSAALLRAMITKSRERDAAEECIMFCKSPFEESESMAAYFTDADYAILGADRAAYTRYANDTMREYTSACGLVEYIHGRMDFLAKMYERKRIFRTDYFEIMLGDAARLNIDAERKYWAMGKHEVNAPPSQPNSNRI